MLASSDTATELVQLCKSEISGVQDRDGGRVRYRDADFDHCGRDQHVEFANDEGVHRLCAVGGLLTACAHRDPQSREGFSAGFRLVFPGTRTARGPTFSQVSAISS